MAFHRGPKTVTDGLVLYLDAANPKSYPGSGTAWSDLSGNGYTGTLTNGPTFNSGNGGSIVFDGTNDFVNLPINAQFNTPSVTFDCWVNLQNRNNRHIIYVNWQGNSLEVNSNRTVTMYNYAGLQYGATTTTTINFGEWANITGLYNHVTETLETYINGILRATRSSTPNTTYSINVHKVSGTDYGGVILGNVSIVRHYNRALSAEEILQNYNATKSRFGL
jgi:hypothetical protein